MRDEQRTRRIGLLARYDYLLEPIEAAAAGPLFQVREVSYRFRLVNRDGREILAYHWHPEGVSSVTGPHLHHSGRLQPLDIGARDAPVLLGEMHLPTGIVSLAQVVRLLITEFRVEPRRDDWEAVLATATALSPE
ncbi:MAG: hypothetical protein ACR2LS_02200 [Thermomicrobiales bacterium]